MSTFKKDVEAAIRKVAAEHNASVRMVDSYRTGRLSFDYEIRRPPRGKWATLFYGVRYSAIYTHKQKDGSLRIKLYICGLSAKKMRKLLRDAGYMAVHVEEIKSSYAGRSIAAYVREPAAA